MSDIASLAILLDGPMQAWGASSRFQRRETEAFPVKSSLVGLLAAAMRIDKHEVGEGDRLAPFAALRVDAYFLPKARPNDPKRSHLPMQRLVDFHTIGGGYPDTVEGKLNVSPVAEKTQSGGLKWKTPDKRTVPTKRTYLTDTRFAAVFTGDAATIQVAADALTNPAWGVWFGRKACLPALPLSPTVAATPDEALAGLLARVAEWDQQEAHDPATLECWQEPEKTGQAEGDFFLHDSPLSFKERAFSVRPVRYRRATKRAPERFSDSSNVAGAFFDALPEVELTASEGSAHEESPE